MISTCDAGAPPGLVEATARNNQGITRGPCPRQCGGLRAQRRIAGSRLAWRCGCGKRSPVVDAGTRRPTRASAWGVLVCGLCGLLSISHPACPESSGGSQAERPPLVVVLERSELGAGHAGVEGLRDGRWYGVRRGADGRAALTCCSRNGVHEVWVPCAWVTPVLDEQVSISREWFRVSELVGDSEDATLSRSLLQDLRNEVRSVVNRPGEPQTQLAQISHLLFVRRGFQHVPYGGADYWRAQTVLASRRGNCLGLSLLYIAVCEGVINDLALVLAPRHAFVRYRRAGDRIDLETSQRGESIDMPKALGPHAQRCRGPSHFRALSHPEVVAVLLTQAAEALVRLGEYRRACELCARAVEIMPWCERPYTTWGNALSNLGHGAAAVVKYREALTVNPSDPIAYCNWGVRLADHDAHAEAIAKFRQASRLDPSYGHTWFAWARMLDDLGRKAEAAEKLLVAARHRQQSAEASCQLATMLCRYGLWRKSIPVFSQVLAEEPGNVTARMNRGAALVESGRFGAACDDLRRVIQDSPKHAKAYYNWGLALAHMRQRSAACLKFQKAISLQPHFPSAYRVWGTMLRLMGRREEAAQKLRRAARQDPSLLPAIRDELRAMEDRSGDR